MSSSCHCLPLHPSLNLPSISRVRFSTRSRSFLPFSRSSHGIRTSSRASKKKCRFSCFVPQESSSGTNQSDFIENKPPDELDKPDLDQTKAENNLWIPSLRKGVDAIFKVPREPWMVPWTAETILQVMLLWIASFWFVGSWIIPFLAHAAGFGKETLTYRGQALYSLLTDVAEGLAGIVILHRCLARFRPLPTNWFRFSLKGKWQFDVLLGCLMFPLVNRLSQINIDLLPLLPTSPVGASSVEQSIVARDPVAMALYAVVVSVCAPVWEEILFRGFLLPSLTRYMPMWGAIFVSAVSFALAHFNAQRMLPLVFLGVVMGAVFARSRNLLASMLLHSLWNGFVFLDLMK
ncbi:CAAX amino terminal protease family protein [Tasmannia lanceolata]|uniref:CAAX amino terminal protease family protein n=1 Tax=Tasmannia lanceolata TaxID=3420 RepID=UPI0040641C26